MESLLHTIAATALSFTAFLFPATHAERHALMFPPVFRPAARVEVMFGGDMMFDRTIRTTMDEKGGNFVFSCIDDVLRHAHMVVANLEGPITANDSKSTGSEVGAPDNYTFTFPTSTAAFLFAHHVSIVNLGNNHIQNFGRSGVRSTMDALRSAGVTYFGDPIEHTVAEREVGGVRLAFINYNEFGPVGWKEEASTTLEQIRNERAKEYITVVYTHWGIEYATTSPPRVQELAHRFVDAGAEIVVGSHPHVIEEHEVYTGKYIYYSLGNFIFDQYWNDAVRHGLLLDVVFSRDGVQSVKGIPVELGRDRRTCPVEATSNPM